MGYSLLEQTFPVHPLEVDTGHGNLNIGFCINNIELDALAD